MNNTFVKSIIIDTPGTIDKGRDKRIVVRIMELNGFRYLDARTFFLIDSNWRTFIKGGAKWNTLQNS